MSENKKPNNIGRGFLSPLFLMVKGPIHPDFVRPNLTVNNEIGLRGSGKISTEGVVTDLQIDSFNLVNENPNMISQDEDDAKYERNKLKRELP